MSPRGYKGRILSRLQGTMSIPGRCDRWGCILPVGPGSTYGAGPTCMVCELNLRHSALTEEENEKWKRTKERR